MSVISPEPARHWATYEKAIPGGPRVVLTQWVDNGEFRDLELIWAGRNRVRLDRRDIGEILTTLLAASEDEVRELSDDYYERKEHAEAQEYERQREEIELAQERAEPTEQQRIDWAIHDDHAQGNDDWDIGGEG
jgi:hypothetical protein